MNSREAECCERFLISHGWCPYAGCLVTVTLPLHLTPEHLCSRFLFIHVALCWVIRRGLWVKVCPLSTRHFWVTVLSKHKQQKVPLPYCVSLKSNTNDTTHDAPHHVASYKAAVYFILLNPLNSLVKYYSQFRKTKLRLRDVEWLVLRVPLSYNWHHQTLNSGFLSPLHYSCFN